MSAMLKRREGARDGFSRREPAVRHLALGDRSGRIPALGQNGNNHNS